MQTRWASPENPRANKGEGGKTKGGRKGRPNVPLLAGQTLVLAEEDANVSGTVRRIWLTVSDRSPLILRGVRVDFFWDEATTPAVSAPLGDFFGVGLGRTVSFVCDLFSNAEGRSFCATHPMPFRKGMRLTLTNETQTDVAMLFYDVNYTIGDAHDENTSYFHAHFRRENPTVLRRDYEFLPIVSGRGRFVGVNVGVRANTEKYGKTWWGEGEAKFYLDGDDAYPTLCGTGTEDYIGTAWGQGNFCHPYQGCTIADDQNMAYCFYRYHIPDPIYFSESVRVTMQQIGHAGGEGLRILAGHVRECGEILYAADGADNLTPADFDADLPHGLLFERQDDWSSCVYFTLDRPENGLPFLVPLAARLD